MKYKIKKRDNFICQRCNITEKKHLIIYNAKLIIHHIDYNKKNSKENNLITLCKKCNSKVNFKRKYWQRYFTKKVAIKSGIIAFDFDAVISTYKRPFKLDKLGKPIKEVVETMQYYFDKGYYILIFTGRRKTEIMEKWLRNYDIPYHGFNTQPKIYKDADNFKPYYNCIIDDKAVNFDFKFNHKSKQQLIEDINKILKVSKRRDNE